MPHLKEEWDFRPACGEQTLQGQLDRLCAASRSAGAHPHTGVSLGGGGSSQSAYNLRTPGGQQEEGLPYKGQGCCEAAPGRYHSFPAPALHHKGVMTLSTVAIGSQTERAGNPARQGNPHRYSQCPRPHTLQRSPKPSHGPILTASASAFSLETLPPATTDSKAVTQRCLSGKLGANK